ncbi:GOLPH3/VPS74 family protein [Sciscionella marina]|uniref:GOLPH3/VPS74 family protein n=1 Tax=Sciscionella marina TaxID=508770 RepID=UPI00146ADABA|nr:GPP34 family phosphoprotein [Sciscionella marina]
MTTAPTGRALAESATAGLLRAVAPWYPVPNHVPWPDDREESDMSRTLPQQLYLLSYNVDKGKLSNSQFRGHLMRAAALAELTIEGYLTDADGKAIADPGKPPADQFLAEVLADSPAQRPRSWRSLVRRRTRAAEATVRSQLAAEGTITVTPARVLGLFPRHEVTVTRDSEVSTLRETARRPVLNQLDPASVPQREAALAVLSAAGELSSVFSRAERREHKRVIRELGDSLGEAAPSLRKAIASIRAAIAASAAHGGG